jgi:flagellar hook assembly protein FlgD
MPTAPGTLVLEGTDPGTVVVQNAGATPRIAPLAVSPSPSSGIVAFEFELARPASVSFEVVDVTGRMLSRMATAMTAAGPHTIRWDGAGAAGDRVAPGVYFVRMLVNERVIDARKLVLLD